MSYFGVEAHILSLAASEYLLRMQTRIRVLPQFANLSSLCFAHTALHIYTKPGWLSAAEHGESENL